MDEIMARYYVVADKEEIEFINRFYALAEKEEIEFLDYNSPNIDIKIEFFKKWKQQTGDCYEEEMTIYIGKPKCFGQFYECYEDFFNRSQADCESDCERLLKEFSPDLSAENG